MAFLVVYFSRTGHTRRVAERLAHELHGSAWPITEAASRAGLWGYLRSAFEAVSGRDAVIAPLGRPLHRNDVVVIGTPVWAWHLSSPVRAFARHHARSIGHTAFFCTMGGAGHLQAFAELQTLLGRRPLATLAVTERELAPGAEALGLQAKIRHFVRELRAAPALANAAAA